VIGLGWHIQERFKGTLGRHNELAVTFEADTCYEIRSGAALKVLHEFKESILALPANNVVHAFSLKRLVGKKRGVPPAEDDREIRVPFLNGACDLYRLPNHGTGDERDPQADSVPNLCEDALFVVGGDRRVNQNDVEPGSYEWGGDGQDA
jgi:hypothetical protein